LNQGTWNTILFEFLRDPLNSLLQEKSIDTNLFHQIVKNFLDEARSKKMEISVDQMRVLLKKLADACNTDFQEHTKQEIETYGEDLTVFNRINQQENPLNLEQLFEDLSSYISSQDNSGLIHLLSDIQKKVSQIEKAENLKHSQNLPQITIMINIGERLERLQQNESTRKSSHYRIIF
jgi:hypothetical protein